MTASNDEVPTPIDSASAGGWTASDRLRRIAARLADCPADADDLVQETLGATLAPNRARSPAAWQAGVLRRLAIRLRRDRARRESRERLAARPESEPSALERVLADEILFELAAAIDALDPAERRLLLARCSGESAPAGIGEAAGVPAGTTRSRLSRIIERLRRTLDRRFGGRESWRRAVGAGLPAAPSTAGSSCFGVISMARDAALFGKTIGGCVLLALLVLLVLFAWRWNREDREASGARGTGAETSTDSEPKEARRGTEASAALVPSTPAPGHRAAPAADPAVDPAQTGVLSIRTVWEKDGGSAPGLQVDLFRSGGPGLGRRRAAGTTDGDGRLRFEGLTPGRYLAITDRRDGGEVEVAAGRDVELVVRVDGGFAITGIVVDGNGIPRGGARILLGHYADPSEFRPIASSGPDGSFTVAGLSRHSLLAAHAAGSLPSRIIVAGRAAESGREIRLELGGDDARLEGVIVDQDGRAVSGAEIQIGEPAPGLQQDSKGWPQSRPVWRRSVSASDGSFEADGLEPGPLPVRVRAIGCGATASTLDLRPGANGAVRIVMMPEVRFEGRVFGAEGAPIEGARVRVTNADPFALLHATAEADGRFGIRGLPPGRHTVEARGPGESRATATFVAVAGHPLHWEARLLLGRAIRGTIVDRAGRPRAAALVTLRSEDQSKPFDLTVATDAEGRFLLASLPGGPFVLTLHAGPGASPLGKHALTPLAPSETRDLGALVID